MIYMLYQYYNQIDLIIVSNSKPHIEKFSNFSKTLTLQQCCHIHNIIFLLMNLATKSAHNSLLSGYSMVCMICNNTIYTIGNPKSKFLIAYTCDIQLLQDITQGDVLNSQCKIFQPLFQGLNRDWIEYKNIPSIMKIHRPHQSLHFHLVYTLCKEDQTQFQACASQGIFTFDPALLVCKLCNNWYCMLGIIFQWTSIFNIRCKQLASDRQGIVNRDRLSTAGNYSQLSELLWLRADEHGMIRTFRNCTQCRHSISDRTELVQVHICRKYMNSLFWLKHNDGYSDSVFLCREAVGSSHSRSLYTFGKLTCRLIFQYTNGTQCLSFLRKFQSKTTRYDPQNTESFFYVSDHPSLPVVRARILQDGAQCFKELILGIYHRTGISGLDAENHEEQSSMGYDIFLDISCSPTSIQMHILGSTLICKLSSIPGGLQHLGRSCNTCRRDPLP